VIALTIQSASAQAVPELTLETYPPVSREPIARALAEVRSRPSDPAATGQLAMLLHAWEQWETASTIYARARRMERRFEWFHLAGIVEERQGHYAEAAALFREAVALSPGSLPARLHLADALLESGALDDAEHVFGALAGEPEAEPHARYGLGRVKAARGNHREAMVELDRAVTLYPEFGAAWYARALSLRRLDRMNEARESLARARQHGTTWPTVIDPALQRVRALRDDASARLSRGLALERQGDVEGAIREHESALAANPELAQAHVNLIVLYARHNEWARAEEHYREALRLGYRGADAHHSYGVALMAQGREAEALEAFKKAVTANPQHAAAWNNLGQLAERSGRLQEALEDYQHAVDAAPSEAAFRFNLGRLLIATGRAREAIPQFERLAQADAPDPRHVYGLATAWVHAGDAAKGRQYAQQARALAAARGENELVAAIDRDLASLPQ
jgi:tetratricopeptide (TPR) repeat protein